MNFSQLPLSGGYIGIERETLRCDQNAMLANTPHPNQLGNVYTHPNITIDYAESLLELVTDAHLSPSAVYAQLLHLHQYTAQHLENNQQLWAASMPCRLPEKSEEIEIGYFGQSNGGKIKRLYRLGLSHRYGRSMQMIAGVHFNYSPPEALWEALAASEYSRVDQAYKNRRYMGMLRNLQRYGWLICHLFGASPAVDKSFSPAHGVLQSFSKETLGWKNATSLRMSQLGYQNKVDFTVSFNRLEDYLSDLAEAVLTPAPAYEYLGLKDAQGEYQQISTHILQIANEYYTAARPKQPIKKGELPVIALKGRGIAYVELRLLDNNPYDPCGISLAQIHFLETFLLWALLTPAAEFTHRDYNELNHNRLRTACCGLNGQQILYHQGEERSSQTWAEELLTQLLPIACALDEQVGGNAYENAIQKQIQANEGKILRLPEQVQQEIATTEYLEWANALSQQHQKVYQQALTPEVQQSLDVLKTRSLKDFAAIEATAQTQAPFEHYLAHYFDSLKKEYLNQEKGEALLDKYAKLGADTPVTQDHEASCGCGCQHQR